jgi:hypothetical protein
MLFEELSKQLSYKIFPQERLSLPKEQYPLSSKQASNNCEMQLLSFSFPKSSFPKQNCHNAHNFLLH